MGENLRITSRQNPRVKDAARLRAGRERRRRGQFLIDGAREIERAVAAGVRCIEAFVCEELCDSAEGRAAVEAMRSAARKCSASRPTSTRNSRSATATMASSSLPKRQAFVGDLRLPAEPLVAVLEGVEKPGNLARFCAAPTRPASMPSSSPTAGPICTTPTRSAPAWAPCSARTFAKRRRPRRSSGCGARHLPIIAARPDAETLYTEVDFRRQPQSCWAAKRRASAMPGTAPTSRRCGCRCSGMADSLNVSTTAAVLFYEALRQRQIKRTKLATTTAPLRLQRRSWSIRRAFAQSFL